MVIRAGISAGDRVVTDGIDRLTEGAKVEVVEAPRAPPLRKRKPPAANTQKGARS